MKNEELRIVAMIGKSFSKSSPPRRGGARRAEGSQKEAADPFIQERRYVYCLSLPSGLRPPPLHGGEDLENDLPIMATILHS
jgi:hypothetical protein